MTEKENNRIQLLELTADIVSSHVSNNAVSQEELPDVIKNVFDCLQGITTASEEPARKLTPAVPIKRSVTPDYIVCLEDGRKLKMLKRHLKTAYNLSPDEYRAKWNLPADYPMVAPSYAQQRRKLAKEIGLGRAGSQAS
jgi:predicted transcriptional regulator